MATTRSRGRGCDLGGRWTDSTRQPVTVVGEMLLTAFHDAEAAGFTTVVAASTESTAIACCSIRPPAFGHETTNQSRSARPGSALRQLGGAVYAGTLAATTCWWTAKRFGSLGSMVTELQWFSSSPKPVVRVKFSTVLGPSRPAAFVVA